MPRIKVQRKSTSVDMTAMCDVTFLLLNFFIMTSTFTPPDPVSIQVPSSTYKIPVPEKDLLILTIGGKGKVFLETLGSDIKIATLEKMGEQYKISFTPEEKKRFSLMSSFGVPIQSLKQYIMMDNKQKKSSGLSQGIPADSTNNQLSDWILQSRKAVAELHTTAMRISIKADQNEEYLSIKKVVDILQKQKINKFSLITNQEGN
ncbi:biopolymer transporter ExbD [Pedobacter sp. WC2423]|uniref:biopolymer transporter ExbD n=1 Tax=Pedobacter sp. WC2423 TaxID=3234142 RepID=UPI0034654DC7